MEWKITKKRFVVGETLFIGTIPVGNVYYDSKVPRDSRWLKYAAICTLPGIEHKIGHFQTEDEAKKEVEAAVENWLKEAGLPYKA